MNNKEPERPKMRILYEGQVSRSKKEKIRIVKRINPDNRIQYVIQQKHFLFRWTWVDAWINSICGASCQDNFDTLEEAKNNLCYFDGSQCKEEVVYNG